MSLLCAIIVLIFMVQMGMDDCQTKYAFNTRRARMQQRKLEFLSITRDLLERRMAALDASISKLKEQIERNSEAANS